MAQQRSITAATLSSEDSSIMENSVLRGETVLDVVLPFLSAPELATVARTNRHFFQLVHTRDDLWESIHQYWNQKHRLAPMRILTEVDLRNPDYFVRHQLRIPPRRSLSTRSETLDVAAASDETTIVLSPQPHHSCHDDDDSSECTTNSRGLPRKRSRLSMEHCNDCHTTSDCRFCASDFNIYSLWRVDESGNLMDYIYSPWKKQPFKWANRKFPVICKDCNVKLQNTKELLHHCASPLHVYQKCRNLLDPRRTPGFDSWSHYEKAKAIRHYPQQVECFFHQLTRQPPNQYRMHQFLGLLEGTIAHVLQRDSIVDAQKELLPARTVHRVTEYCVEWITNMTLHFDFFNHAKQVAYVGWQAIDFYGSGLGYDMCISLTGIPPPHFDYLIKD